MNKTVQSLAAVHVVKCAGLAITNTVLTSSVNYTESTLVCSHHSQEIQGKTEYCKYVHKSTARKSSLETLAQQQDTAEAALIVTLDLLPYTDGKPQAKQIIAQGYETG